MKNINSENELLKPNEYNFLNFGNDNSFDEIKLVELEKEIICNFKSEKDSRIKACIALKKAFELLKNEENQCKKWCKEKINIKKNKASAMKKRAILYEEFGNQFKEYIIDASDNLILFITKKEYEIHVKEILSSNLKSIIKLKEKFSLEKKSTSIEEKISRLEKKLDKLKSQK